jgi:hypothetical protein
MTRSAPPSVDGLEPLWRPAVVDEVCDLMKALRPSDLTGCEVLGLLALLRSAMDRVGSYGPATTASIVKLSVIRAAKTGPVKR